MDTEKILELTKKLALLRHSVVRQTLAQYGLHPSQPELLFYIQQNPGCSQRQMAEDAGVTAASVAASFKRLENAGFIRRRSDTSDLRCNRVYLTERGQEELAKCMREMERINASMLDGLDDQQLACLRGCLEKITENLRQAKKAGTLDIPPR